MFFLIKQDVRGYSLATMVISVTVLAFIVTAITMWGISFSKGVEKAKANAQYENAGFVKINSLIASDYSTLESVPKNDADEIPVSVTVSEEKDINGTKGKVVNIKVYDKDNKNRLRKDFSTNIYAPLKPSTDYVYNLDKAINQVSVSKWQEPRTKRWFIRPKVNGEMTTFYSTNGIDIDMGIQTMLIHHFIRSGIQILLGQMVNPFLITVSLWNERISFCTENEI